MTVDDIPKALAWWVGASIVATCAWCLVAERRNKVRAANRRRSHARHLANQQSIGNTPLYDALARMKPTAVDAIAAAYAANFDPDLCDWTQRKDRA